MKYVELEDRSRGRFLGLLCKFTAFVRQHLEQYIISVIEDLVKQCLSSAEFPQPYRKIETRVAINLPGGGEWLLNFEARYGTKWPILC